MTSAFRKLAFPAHQHPSTSSTAVFSLLRRNAVSSAGSRTSSGSSSQCAAGSITPSLTLVVPRSFSTAAAVAGGDHAASAVLGGEPPPPPDLPATHSAPRRIDNKIRGLTTLKKNPHLNQADGLTDPNAREIAARYADHPHENVDNFGVYHAPKVAPDWTMYQTKAGSSYVLRRSVFRKKEDCLQSFAMILVRPRFGTNVFLHDD